MRRIIRRDRARSQRACRSPRRFPNFLIQERGDNEYADLLAKPLPPVKNGYRALPTDPGLGITIDEDKLKAQVGEPRPYLPHYDDEDGSVVDW